MLTWISVRTDTQSLTELRRMYPDQEDKISKIGSDHEDVELETDPEVLARFEDRCRPQKHSTWLPGPGA